MRPSSKVFVRVTAILLAVALLLLAARPSVAIGVGDRVQANDTVNVRQTAAGAVLGTQSLGSRGTVVGGPTTASLSGVSHTWYNVNFDSGVDGWVADIGLTVLQCDIVVQGTPTISPNPVTAGNSINVSYTIHNNGPDNAGASQTKIQIKNSSGTQITAPTFSAPAVNASANSSTQSNSVTIPAGTPAGTYTAFVVLDNLNGLNQSNRNNDLTSGVNFTVSAPVQQLPDLAPQNVSLSSGTAAAGGTLTVTFDIRNQGGGNAGTTTTRLRLNQSPSTTSAADVSLGDVSTPAVGANSVASGLNKLVTIPAGTAAGTYYIWVVADNGAALTQSNYTNDYAHSSAFTLTTSGPTITSVSPNPLTGSNGDQTLTLNGSGFVSGAKVRLRCAAFGIDATKTATFAGSTQLTVSATFGNDPSTWTAQVVNPNSAVSGQFTFTVQAPTPVIQSLSPASASAGGAAFTLRVSGNTFHQTSVVRWNGANRTTTPVVSGGGLTTALDAQILASDIASSGTASVTVNNPGPGGGASAASTFTINGGGLTVSGISPSSYPASGVSQPMTINGSNFQSGATLTFLDPHGTSFPSNALKLTFVSSSRIDYQFNNDNDAGAWSVKVNNPNGQSSNAVSFTVTAPTGGPTISSVSPNPVTGSNISQPFTINGTGFTSHSTVNLRDKTTGEPFNDRPIKSQTATQIVITPVFTTASHTWSVQVLDGNLSSEEFTFQVIAPAGAVGPPVIISPGSASSPGPAVSNLTPTFTWNAAAGASSYGLYIRDMSAAGTPIVYPDGGVTTTPLTGVSFVLPNGYLVSGHTYRWNMTSFVGTTESTTVSERLYFHAPDPPAGECAYADDYPYPAADFKEADPWLFFYRECTSYVAWRMNRDAGTRYPPYSFTNRMGGLHFGDAYNWGVNAAALGFLVDRAPAVGAIAHWGANELGALGHVAYVERVNSDGSVNLSEYNYHLDHKYGVRCNVPAASVPRFIHVAPTSLSRNPSAEEVAAQIRQFAEKYQIPANVIAAVAWKENGWRHFDANGNPQIGVTGDVGMMQINVLKPAIDFDAELVRKDWVYNLETGCRILKDKFRISGKDTLSPYDSAHDANPAILENWYYPVAWYNGPGPAAYSYVTVVWGYLKSLPAPARNYFSSVPDLADPNTLNSFPDTIYTDIPYPKNSLNVAVATPGELVSHGMYTLLILVQNGQEIHRWDWAAGTAADITSTIAGPPPPPRATINFSAPSLAVSESAGVAAVTATRTGDVSGTATVEFATVDDTSAVPCSAVNGTAYARCDYSTTAQTLNFAAGETSKTIMLPLTDDAYVEGTETTQLRLRNAVGAALGTQNTATAIIVDNDTAQPTTNPLDNADAQFYVRQQYYDFLNREPDAPGLQFWTGGITTCGSEAGCIEVKRVNTSGAFFLSIEFQETGYLVHRIYKAAFGDATGASTFPSAHQLSVPVVRFQDFLRDTQKIGQGVVVRQAGWEQLLESNKQAFVLGFVQQQRFVDALPSTMSAAEFVNKLDQNAGRVLSDGEVAQLVASLGSTPSDPTKRAAVLRQVAENANLRRQEFNRAFVLMQYFGYLRRNPDDPQDKDYTGYDFWLTKLNQFNGNFVSAEMVKAFITSTEYRQRFGQP